MSERDMVDHDAVDRAAAGPEEAELTPELRQAISALRRIPPTSPGAVARIAAAAAADQRASAGVARRARLRRWSAGAVAAVAAGVALFVARERRAGPDTAPASTAASAAPAAHGARVPVLRAVGNASEASSGDVLSDAPRPVTFVLRRPDARAVAVVGDFNRWDARATPLARGPDGGWAVTLPLAPGRHAYRFIVDDSLRVLDPRAPSERDVDFGVARSIVVVGAP